MAVYTKLDEKDIQDHLKNYSIGELISFKEIVEGIDNSNFILETTNFSAKEKFILTIFEARIKPEELAFFINLKLHLAQKGICCPRPILNNSGDSIVDLKGKKSAIVTFLKGTMLKAKDNGFYDKITKKHCFEIGKVLAELHLAAKDFKMIRANDVGIDNFDKLVGKFSHLASKESLQEINKDLVFLKKSWRNELPESACHLDLFPDNVFFNENDEVSGVIDFYFAATDLLVYDFAVIVNAWCFDENNNFIQERFDKMLFGYETIRKFTKEEKEFLNIALMAAAMRFLLTRMNDKFFTPADSLVRVKNPQEYLEKLRFFKEKLTN